MKSKENYIIEECRHCGNKTKLDIMGKYTEYGDPEYDYVWVRDWLLLKCCACGKVSLGSIYSGEDTRTWNPDDPDEYEEIYITSFPVETYQGTNVPDKVNNAFSSALKAHYVDNIVCLMALRRTLEIICKDKGATGNTLEKKIIDLSQKNIFPQVINEASDVLRILGNEAAHGDDINYDERIVKEMINFTQIIIEYVYVIPYRLGNIKKNIAKKKSLNQSVNS